MHYLERLRSAWADGKHPICINLAAAIEVIDLWAVDAMAEGGHAPPDFRLGAGGKS
jgi:hypothetical protein